MQNISLEESSAQLNTLKKAPSPDATQYHSKKKDATMLEHELDSLLRENVTTLRKRRTLHKIKDIAIDFHQVPWYGESKAWIVGGKHRQGTSYYRPVCNPWGWKGERGYTSRPFRPLSSRRKNEQWKNFLGFAFKLGIRIQRLYFDRAFPTTPIIKVLVKFDVDWIAAFKKYDKVNAAIKDAHRNGGS